MILEHFKSLLAFVAFVICGIAFVWYHVATLIAFISGLALGFCILVSPLVFLSGQGVKVHLMIELLRVFASCVVVYLSLSWSPRVFKRWWEAGSIQLFPKKNLTPDKLEGRSCLD